MVGLRFDCRLPDSRRFLRGFGTFPRCPGFLLRHTFRRDALPLGKLFGCRPLVRSIIAPAVRLGLMEQRPRRHLAIDADTLPHVPRIFGAEGVGLLAPAFPQVKARVPDFGLDRHPDLHPAIAVTGWNELKRLSDSVAHTKRPIRSKARAMHTPACFQKCPLAA